MKLLLTQCNASRPDKRAIAKVLEEYAMLSKGDASEQTGFLIEGSEIEIDFTDAQISTVYRLMRKHDIDYDIID